MAEDQEVTAVAEGAESTPGESSTPTEDSTAKETGKETRDAESNTSQETASPGDDPDGADQVKPGEDGRVPYDRFQAMVKAKNTKIEAASAFQSELKELGIESKDHAEFLRREADRLEVLTDQIENKPEEFFQNFRRDYPKQYSAHVEQVSSQAMVNFLTTYADSYRRRGEQGDSGIAETLEALAEFARDGGKKKLEPSRASKEGDAERQSLQSERWDFFAEQTTSDIGSVLTGKINESIKSQGVEFRTERQRTKFMDSVMRDVDEEMEANPIFVRERTEAQSSRHGLTRNQRNNVVDLYVRNATAGGRLERAVQENLSLMGLSGSAGGGKDGKKPGEVRREVNSSGAPTSGTVTKDAKERIKQEIRSEGYEGADAMKEYMKRMSKLRSG